jgi:hypothetical protein
MVCLWSEPIVYGLVRSGMVWYGLVWYGLAWSGMAWYGLVWPGLWSNPRFNCTQSRGNPLELITRTQVR